jgi:putative hemolysin
MAESIRSAGPIDLRRVIGQKSETLLRIVPEPVLRYLERVVHVRELNETLTDLDGRHGLDFVRGALEHLGARVETRFAELLDGVPRPIVAANHPLGGLDGLALLVAVGERQADVVLPANDLLMHLEGLRPILVPVNKHGSNRPNLAVLEGAFAGEKTVVHFPAGLCSRKKGKTIRDLDWQKSFVVRAIRYERTIVPAHIEGHNSAFFYNLARLRRWLGIPFNIEMLYLVDEMFKQRGRAITITFGHPIPHTAFTGARSSWEWTRRLKHHVYRIARDPDASFVPHA